jgi:uncharacterized protein (TIGR02246 family)
MRVPSAIGATLMAVVLTACSAPTPTEFGKEDQAAIATVIQEFTTAYNAKDAAKMATLFSGGAGLMPPNAPTLRGPASIEQYFVSRFAQGASGLVMEPKDVAGAGAFAYTSGDYRLKLAPAGAPEQRDRGKFLWILKDYNGKWLLEYLIFSSDFPAGPAPG